jgi:hypothetical protein
MPTTSQGEHGLVLPNCIKALENELFPLSGMSTGKGESEDSDKSFTMIYFRA